VPAQLALVRHGQTAWNAERRFQGHADVTLSEAGRAEARALAKRLRDEPVTALYSSPLRRALETAEIVASVVGVPVRSDERLREIDVGSWQGLTRDDVETRFPDGYRRWLGGEPGWNGGEPYDELAARVLPALLDLAQRHEDGLVVAVTHGGPMRVALTAAGGSAYALGSVANCALVRFAVREGQIEAVD
jgi:2,3-bisphosphoglycerate-dependent phosphoglycerate mutase